MKQVINAQLFAKRNFLKASFCVVLQWTLELPVDSCIKSLGRTALHWAAENGDVDMCRLLVTRKAPKPSAPSRVVTLPNLARFTHSRGTAH